MPYPHVTQFETIALRADADRRLARELRRAAPARRLRRLPFGRVAALH